MEQNSPAEWEEQIETRGDSSVPQDERSALLDEQSER